MFLKTINGREGRLLFVTTDLVNVFNSTKTSLSNLNEIELYHKLLSYKELALFFKVNLEMYRILGVQGKPFTPNLRDLELNAFDKAILEIEGLNVIEGLLDNVKDYRVLKLGNDLVIVLNTEVEPKGLTSFNLLKHTSLPLAVLEAIINKYGYYNTHYQAIPNIGENELAVWNLYRAQLVA